MRIDEDEQCLLAIQIDNSRADPNYVLEAVGVTRIDDLIVFDADGFADRAVPSIVHAAPASPF